MPRKNKLFALVRTNLLFVLLSSCLLLISCTENSDRRLFAFVNSNGDWGYFDSEGKIAITPQFKSAHPFKNGLARVEIGMDEKSVFTFIDEEGNYDILKSWDVAQDFSDGLAIVRNDLGYPMAINRELEVVLEFPEAMSVSKFSEGRAFKTIYDSGRIYLILIDKTGNNIKYLSGIEPSELSFNQLGIRTSFKNGLSIFNRANKGSLTVLDQNGDMVDVFDEGIVKIGDFIDGVAIAQFSDKKWGLIQTNGEIIVNPQFDGIYIDGDNYMVKTGDKWGWVDSEGKFIINPQFTEINSRGFNNTDLAPVKIGDKWGFIGLDGKLEINPQYDFVSSFYGKIAFVFQKGAGHGLIDQEGNFIANPQFDDVLPEYYRIQPSFIEELKFEDFMVMSDYFDVDSVVDVIKANFNEQGIYGRDLGAFSLYNLLTAKRKGLTFLDNSCSIPSGYRVSSVSNYKNSFMYYDTKYQIEMYYDEGYHEMNNTSDLNIDPEKIKGFTNLFKIFWVVWEEEQDNFQKSVCDNNILHLDNTTFYADVTDSRIIRQGFNNVTSLVYNPSKDNFMDFEKVEFNFKVRTYAQLNSEKSKILEERLKGKFVDGLNLGNNACFSPSFELSASGDLKMKLVPCIQ